ncbi:MAG: Mannose-phosphate guanylyltransferase [Verrucomicrobiales bacterium]|nr:Mannose-phosphate guanylyltransferase [Verrucomicrobiales bacterium]
MKSLLICPEESIGLRDLTREIPLAAIPLFGKPLITYWIDHLAALGAKEITILSSDRPEKIREIVSDGAAWGIKIEVIPERNVATLEEARQMYVLRPEEWLSGPSAVVEARCLPNRPDKIIHNYETFFTEVRCWMPHAQKNRVGMKEIAPGIWASLRCYISPRAILKAPCWIEDNAQIEDGAIIGPMTVLESNVIVGQNALVAHSLVQPNTYVGEMLTVEDSIVRGSMLINWKNGSSVQIPDGFLLAQLEKPGATKYTPSLFGRFVALNVMALTSPLAAIHLLLSAVQRKPALKQCRASRGEGKPESVYYKFNNLSEYTARWPQLWNIVCGEFTWFGNRPLTPSQASDLSDDFEKLWLEGPIGLLSQADAEGCWNVDSDEAKAHASFYSVQRNWSVNLKILKGVLLHRPAPRPPAETTAARRELARPNRFSNTVTAAIRRL